MGKAVGGLPETPALAPAPGGEPPFALGSWLARQRELRGISREELAAATRLPMRSLERLEAGAFDGQRDGFVRGFVRTVALAIGLDADDAVARLLAGPAAHTRRRTLDPRRVATAAIGLLGLLLGAVALLEWRSEAVPAADAEPPAALLRADPVRALAAERGLIDAAAGAGVEGLALEPPASGDSGAAPAGAGPSGPPPAE